MSKNKPFYAVLCLALCVFLVIVAIGGFITGIWTGDERWNLTAVTLLFTGIVTGCIAGFGLTDV